MNEEQLIIAMNTALSVNNKHITLEEAMFEVERITDELDIDEVDEISTDMELDEYYREQFHIDDADITEVQRKPTRNRSHKNSKDKNKPKFKRRNRRKGDNIDDYV